MERHHELQSDTWVVSVPIDWVEEPTEGGAFKVESADGAKAMYISTWNVRDGASRSSEEIAEYFKQVDQKALHEMDGYTWEIVGNHVAHSNASSLLIVDSFDEAKNYSVIASLRFREPAI